MAGKIPDLEAIGIKAVKIEGRQRSPVYVQQVTSVWRKALDSFSRDPQNFSVKPKWENTLSKVSEGSTTTLGAYSRAWQ